MALIKGAGATAVAFAEFVKGKAAAAILEKNGFSVPAQ
jgi:ABC-type molybdate transport system substrate-binding protein